MALTDTLGLLFEINADPKNAIARMAELDAASVASATSVKSVWSSAMQAITGPTGIALGAMAGLGGIMLEAANKAAEAGNEIYEAGEKTGMSAEALSGLMAVSKETGTSFEGLANAFARGSRNIAQAADTGKGALTAFFSQAELQALKLRPVDEQMQVVLHRIFALSNEGERNRELQALLGRGWMENISVLKMLATEGYGPAIEQAKKLHVLFDDKAAREAHQYQIEMRQLSGEVSGLGIAVGRELVPHMAEWAAELLTVRYDIQLLEIGLKAQALSMVNLGGIFAKQLDDLAKEATDVYTAQHNALLKYKQEIASLAEGATNADKLGTAHEHAAKAVKEHAAAAEHLATVLPPVIAEMERIEKSKADEAIKKQALALLDYGRAFQPLASGPLALPPFNANLTTTLSLFQQLPPYIDRQATSVTKLTAAQRELVTITKLLAPEFNALDPLIVKLSQQLDNFSARVQQDFGSVVQATMQAGIAAAIYGKNVGQAMAEAAKATLAGIAEQAGVKCLWELAEAAAMEALFYFSENPKYEASAISHLESAAIFGALGAAAGGAAAAMPGGGGARAGAGSGREDYGHDGYGDSGGGIGAGRQGVAGNSLAPGAQGSNGGRLNVYVVGDEAEFIAKRVNAADQAGHFMQVTASRRSSPAQG